MGNRNHGRLLKKATAAGLACLLLVAGLPLPAAAAESCQGWRTAKFFETATVDEVRVCLSAGEDPNEPDRKGLTALHRAARETSDPAVIEVLLDAGANPRAYSIAGRLPWDFARRNDKIKGSDAYQRLRVESAKKADWSRVQAVARDTKTKVLLYQDAAPRENRMIKGRFDSATADSITLRLEDGQTRVFPKQAVHKVRIPRPFSKRWPGWVALGITFGVLQTLLSMSDSVDNVPVSGMLLSHAGLTLPVTTGVFFGSRLGPIYDVPPKHRMPPQADKQSVYQGNASGKQGDPQE